MPCRINDILVSGIATVKNVYASSLFVKKVYICIVFQYLNIMKKVCILFVSCILWFCSFGQGTAYLTKSHASGYSKLIRQYSNSPGQHVVIFTDDVTDTKCYIGVTDVYTNIKGTSINCPAGANFQYPRTNKAFVFWKDYQKVSASGRCLGADFLPVHTLSTISPGIVVGTVAGTYCPGSTSPQTRTPINKRIYNLCH